MKKEQPNMALKIFLDVNIILDFFLKRKDYLFVEQIISLAANKRCQAYVTTSIIHMVGYHLAKAVGNKISKACLLELLMNVVVIEMSHEIVIAALHSKITDSEDALQYYTALHHKLHCFISRDKALKKSSIPALPVYEPEEFLKELSTN